jgi:acyl-ACP thioesterase
MRVIEFVPLSDEGRRFSTNRRVRLSDCGPDGQLRLDGVARYLQDIGSDDWDDVDASSEYTWVVRRTAIRLADGARWPTLGEWVTLTTWCGGTGAAWAERRTNIALSDEVMVETASLWVPVNASGQPQRLPSYFLDLYGVAARGRRISGKVTLSSPPSDAARRPWPLRRSDVDIVDHVNNAAIWQAAYEAIDGPVREATLTFHGPVLLSDAITMFTVPGKLWLVIDGAVSVSGDFA